MEKSQNLNYCPHCGKLPFNLNWGFCFNCKWQSCGKIGCKKMSKNRYCDAHICSHYGCSFPINSQFIHTVNIERPNEKYSGFCVIHG